MITSFFKPKKRSSSSLSKHSEATTEMDPKSDSDTTMTTTSDDVAAEAGEEEYGGQNQNQKKRSKISHNPLPTLTSRRRSSISTTTTSPYTPEVQELISHLHDGTGWKEALASTTTSLFTTPAFVQLAQFVAQERRLSHTIIYPPACDTWTALNACPLDQVKVVILGQDPYHGPGQAHGLCFSVRPHIRPLPPSLKNIYQELLNDPNIEQFGVGTPTTSSTSTTTTTTTTLTTKSAKQQTLPFSSKPQRNGSTSTTKNVTTRRCPPSHGHLIRWAQQGVLLLNTVWTVQKGKAQSHQNKGWELVTTTVLRTLLATATANKNNNKNKPIVFLIWGKPAWKRIQEVMASSSSTKNNKNNIVLISTSHPSPLGARKTDTPFLGSQCFSRCNTALERMGMTTIDWNVDGPLP
ncbi:hypothetical protein ACA910_004335 [Epithemia clementina (nom. ined.)]